MALKSGYKTTEFYVTGLTIVGLVLGSVAGNLPDKYAAIVSGVAASAYAISRGLAKLKAGGEV